MMRRILDWFDSPRFCPDCGDPIKVVDLPGSFDPRTGKPKHRWVWKCPSVLVDISDSGTYAEQWGVNHIHAWGRGKPRWHAAREEPTDD